MNLLAVAVVLMLTVVQSFAQTKCCMPNQCSMVMTELATINGMDMRMLNTQMDFVLKKQVLVDVTRNLNTGELTTNGYTLIDYNQNIMYYVPGNNASQCYTLTNTQSQIQCIPDDAQYLGSSYLGPMANSLDYDAWRFMHGGLTLTIAMARNGCVPLVEGINVQSNPAGNKLYLFTGFTPSLVDPDLFVPPPSCNQK